MNRNFTIMKNVGKIMGVAIMLLGALLTCSDLVAQDGNSKIRIKVQTSENGNTKTFEKEYNNRTEMENDPEYKEFFGDKPPAVFHFKNGTSGFNFDMDHDFKWVDSLKRNFQGNSFFFKSDEDDDSRIFFKMDTADYQGKIKFFFNDEDNEGSSFNFDFDESMEELKKRLEKLNEEMDMDVFFFDGNSGSDSDAQEELIQRLRGFSGSSDVFDGKRNSIIIIKKNVLIKDLEESDKELKKIGNRKAKSLELEDFSYYPNPSNGKFNIRFQVEDETPLQVKIYNLSGREIYGESYDSFSGSFKSEIDVSRHDNGVYLLEITMGNKVLNKKLIIE